MGDHGGTEPGTERAPPDPVRAPSAGTPRHVWRRRTADRIDVERALAGLSRRQREVAVLRYYLQLDTREVASALQINEGTVKSTLFRARAAIAEALSIDDSEEANDRGPR
jgi:DNA-directed RNA polymerase specialized sigma24 family protein